MAGNGDKNRPNKDPRLITRSAREDFERKKELRKKFEKYIGDDGKAYIRRKGAQD